MNYVVVDFEWNQSSYGRGSENHRIPFEIIEIGAVMLDENLQEIDRFSETIRPKLYKKLHYVTRELTGITQAELNASEPFPYVLVDFMLWCGEDYIFCTWGNTDLVELQRNMKFYHLEDLLEGPIRYYNVQKFFRKFFRPEAGSASLESAVDFFGLAKSANFHRAINDAEYTAEIFKQMDPEKVDEYFSVDFYQNPKSKEEELHIYYRDYYKYVSREFYSKEDAFDDREVRSVRCFICDQPTKKKLGWFAGKTKNYFCLGYCPEHGYISGRIHIKRTDRDRVFAVKTLSLTDEQGAEKLQQMKQEVVDRRREKRHRGSDAPAHREENKEAEE